MSELTNTAPGQETQTVQQPTQETIGETMNKAKEAQVVPLAAHIELKKEYKRLEGEIKDLKKSVELGASKKEVAASIDALVSEFPDVDPTFLRKLSQSIAADAETKAEQKLAERLKPLQEREEVARIEAIFGEYFDKAVSELPEYKDVVNREVIKQLSLLPQNANKTFSQLIEETYKNAAIGKRSIDTAATRVSKDSEATVDVEKAQRDPAYMKEVMANPELKKQYREGIVGRISSYL
jgi:hypothetical protein